MSPPGFGPSVDTTIECTPRAPAIARRVLERLAGTLDGGVLRDAQLLISELVTNSIRHSGSDDPIRIRIWPRRQGLKVEVADGGLGFEAGAPAGGGEGEGEGGRGLLILDSVADRWGVGSDAGTRVWFELSPDSVGRGARAS